MTTPYNTGKVRIGSAYTPRIEPLASHGISGPHRRRFFDGPDRVVMATCALAIAALAVILLAGCGQRQADGAGSAFPVVHKWGPDEHGVVCYAQRYDHLACVKVAP